GSVQKHSKEKDTMLSTNTEHNSSAVELYCICRTPYDDSKFYIACDQCQDWFHGSCVGISKCEAEQLDTYSCPSCKQTSSRSSGNQNKLLTDEQWIEVHKVIRLLKVHKNAWPFLQPVDAAQVPDYYKIIKEPMDMTTIEEKTCSRKYETLNDFVKDVMQIFDNCRYYNARNTTFYKCADILEIYFVNKLKTLRSKLNDM
ncbi:hypothetical protein HELRODRAFT_67491, partial [Helobdella robusta]|uniref:Bromo domain-containing protein n=1 Tax=Helobdella robusta TaxID=6412 RepID=T1FZ17_HELRO